MLNRRTFQKLLLSSLLTAGPLSAASASGAGNASRKNLNRLTYGATTSDMTRIERMGYENWLDAELAKPPSDPGLDASLANARLRISYEAGETAQGAKWKARDAFLPLDRHKTDPSDLLKYLDFEQGYAWEERIRASREVIAASLLRARNADGQLREVMAQFWHEHFSVNALSDEHTAIYFPQYDAMMRQHALGNFRELLEAVATAPAMLIYLNNDASRASPANENYARELLELHTLGAENYANDHYDDWKAVPGALEGKAERYIDWDVYEVARAFTGWTVGDGRWIGDGDYAPRTGQFAYVEAWHDPYQKRILGREFGPNRGAMEDGRDVLDMLAEHPGTARFVTGKMLRRLGIEQPSASYHARVAKVFAAHSNAPDQIAKTVRAIALDTEFDQTPPTKLRRPFEYLVALYRATGAQVDISDTPIFWFLSRMGWTQHRVRPPTGHSDDTDDWANTRALKGLSDIALFAHDDWMELARWTPGEVPEPNIKSWGGLASYWAKQFGTTPETLDAGLEYLGVGRDEELSDEADYLAWANRSLVSLAAVSPGFLFR